jgi:hypothetical protein
MVAGSPVAAQTIAVFEECCNFFLAEANAGRLNLSKQPDLKMRIKSFGTL